MVIALAACSPSPAPGSEPAPSADGGKSDLPNDEVTEHDLDTLGYRAITQHFLDAGYVLDADPSMLNTRWPLDDPQTVLLSRFGTPVQNSAAGFGWYLHDAADISRSSAEVERNVYAPVSGHAKVFDWGGERPDPFRPYSSVIAIYEPQSRVLLQLMHVSAASPLRHSAFVEVEQGQLIGQLAPPSGVRDEFAGAYFHTHLTMVDGASMRMFDPLPHLPYRDNIAPEVLDLYALDEDAVVQRDLVDGRLDIVLEVADLDDESGRNFEPAAIAYEIRDAQGMVLARSERCDFRSFLADIRQDLQPPVASLIDFGSAAHQIGPGGWAHNDQGNPENTYRYALTQFAVGPEGVCHILEDEDGFIEVDSSILRLDVTARLWDPSGNETTWSGRLAR